MLSRPFQVFVKPAGAACNLACRYCYYLEKWDSLAVPRIADRLLDAYIAQHIEASPTTDVLFSWHGGEPTLLGLDFFRSVVAIQARHARRGTRVVNGIQTNGVLVTDEWARFFSEHAFRVGLSLDGPADLHDGFRQSRGGGPTHAAALQAFEALSRHRVPTDILCAVHAGNVAHPLPVYRFLRKIGARAVGFLPVVRRVGGAAGVSAESVGPQAYGSFLCAVFDEWVARDARRIEVQLFDEAARPARGLEQRLCVFRPTCGDVPVLEHDGSVYACDHFADGAHRIGNLAETRLERLLADPALAAFGEAKRSTLPRECRACELLPMCNGGCPKDRFVAGSEEGSPLNYLCPAYKTFFAHALPWIVRCGVEARAGVGWTDTRTRGDGPLPGRNDPCPCGSGRKYKKCCGNTS